jgi:hypothetical protein
VELALFPSRPLLVLDLNGVLLKRFPPGDARRGKEVGSIAASDAHRVTWCRIQKDVHQERRRIGR